MICLLLEQIWSIRMRALISDRLRALGRSVLVKTTITFLIQIRNSI